VLGAKFSGKTFANAALIVYKAFGAILFGLELVLGHNSKIFLNPKNLVIPSTCRIIGYIIAPDKTVADDIQNYDDADTVSAVANTAPEQLNRYDTIVETHAVLSSPPGNGT
jgi:hypothetical protein